MARDLHKACIMGGAVAATKQVVVPLRRVTLTQFAGWATRHLWSSDQAVLEATSNAWVVYDLWTPRVARLLVATSAQVPVIAAAAVKTDKWDT